MRSSYLLECMYNHLKSNFCTCPVVVPTSAEIIIRVFLLLWKVEFYGIHEYLQLEQEYLLLH